MTKDVTQSSLTASTPATKLADQVLGRIASPRTRWNTASLVAAVTAAVEAPLFLMLTPDFLGVAEITDANFSLSEHQLTIGVPNFADPSSSGTLGYFRADAGNTRSRPILPGFGSNVVVSPPVVTLNGTNYHEGLMSSILAARPPSLTLQQLVGRCLDFLEESQYATNYTICVDQSSGIVAVFTTNKAVTDFLEAVYDVPSFSNPLVFELEEPQDPGTEPFVQKPFWG